MARFADRIAVSSTSVGTGSFTLGAALVGYRLFSAGFTNGLVPYGIIDETTGAWEIGEGTLTGTTLARTTLFSSSTGSLINFAAGTKTVYSPMPAAWMNMDMGAY
jgi:hypothetical protein